MKTNHRNEIVALRAVANTPVVRSDLERQTLEVAADLLEMHDATGISLDDWPAARSLVENLIGHPITENHA